MSGDALLLVFLGTCFTVLSLLAFLFALRFGLRRRKWFPLVAITVLWLIAMGAYALLESGTGPDSSRQRIGQNIGQNLGLNIGLNIGQNMSANNRLVFETGEEFIPKD